MLNFLQAARRVRYLMNVASLAALFAVISVSLFGAFAVATGATDFTWAWARTDARPSHWMISAIKTTAAPAIVIGFILPVVSIAEAGLFFGAFVAACLNRHPFEGAYLAIASLALLMLAGVQTWLAEFVGTIVAGICARLPQRQRQRSPNEPPPDIQADLNLYKAERPRRTFAHIAGMAEIKGRLLEAAGAARERKPDAPNGILLHGEPGNGKTLFAEALAGELELPFLSVSIADIVSKWVGQTPEQLSAVFRAAQRQAPCVLFVDEVDSVIADRTQANGTQDAQNTTNVFLAEVVRLRGHGVVIVAATNFLDRLDAAAVREGRFDHKIEVTVPDEPARIGLLRVGLAQQAPRIRVADAVVRSVARRWVGFSVSRLLAVAREVPAYAREHGLKELQFSDLMACLRRVQGRQHRVPESTKSLAELTLLPSQRKALETIAQRMKEAHETEALGGTLPQGLLFWGPPGTGKTEAARALARETGWSFLGTSGNELLSDPTAIDRLYRQAKEARPAIVFIDEADDVLMDRQFSAARGVTNKLLTIVDGAAGKVPDLLFIAATNHPQVMDSAALRGGRFTEKVEFAPPGEDELALLIARWLADKGWQAQDSQDDVARLLEGRAIADVQAVLQAAVNDSIASAQRAGAAVTRILGKAELRTAMRTVLTPPSFDDAGRRD
jgi:transitional endoplasmic reticulum ATPase